MGKRIEFLREALPSVMRMRSSPVLTFMNEATALVLVDLQTAAFDGVAIPPVHRPDRLLRSVRALLETARASGLPVLHIQHCARPGDAFAEGAPGWPIFVPVAPEGSELLVRKRASDAFEGTDLHARLQEIGVRRRSAVEGGGCGLGATRVPGMGAAHPFGMAWRKGGMSAGDSGAGEVQRFVAEIARRVDA